MKIYVKAAEYHNSFKELNKFIGKDLWVLVNHTHAGRAWLRFLDVKSNEHGVYYKVNVASINPASRNQERDSSEVDMRYQEYLDIVQPEQVKTSEELFSE